MPSTRVFGRKIPVVLRKAFLQLPVGPFPRQNPKVNRLAEVECNLSDHYPAVATRAKEAHRLWNEIINVVAGNGMFSSMA